MRAKKSYPRIDRHGAYAEMAAELAQETGADVEQVYEQFCDRVMANLFTAEMDVEECEERAMADVRDWFRRAS